MSSTVSPDDKTAISKEQKPKRTGAHLFQKGQSGNPSGRTTEKVTLDDGTVVSLRALARKHTSKAFEVLLKSMDSGDERVATAAAEAVLSRGWGKAAQAVTGEDGEGPVNIAHSINVKFVGK